jgi:hypothetical protein
MIGKLMIMRRIIVMDLLIRSMIVLMIGLSLVSCSRVRIADEPGLKPPYTQGTEEVEIGVLIDVIQF